MNRALLSSTKHDWMTPSVVLERVRMVAPIALDPCTTEDNPTGAKLAFYPPTYDGLSVGWAGPAIAVAGLTYVNPPYGREIGAWVDGCVEAAAPYDLSGHEFHPEIIALVPARVDTAWYRRCVETAQAIRFWNGRLTFKGAPHPAPFPSALIYWGDRARRFHRAFADVTTVGATAEK